MMVTKRETLNHEDHGAQNAQVWKKMVALSPLSFSLIFIFILVGSLSSFLWASLASFISSHGTMLQ